MVRTRLSIERVPAWSERLEVLHVWSLKHKQGLRPGSQGAKRRLNLRGRSLVPSHCLSLPPLRVRGGTRLAFPRLEGYVPIESDLAWH